MNIRELKFDKDGLMPAVVQDFFTKEVLTVAYMNEESLKITMTEKRTCFFSRSRQELWRKGETSGNVQNVVSVKLDCDNDALVVQVVKTGPACHLGTDSCFTKVLFEDESMQRISLEGLYGLLLERKENSPKGSYTSYLFEKGKEKILKKVGEECTEVVIACMKDDKRETIFEVSDLCYHILVMMADMGITVDDVRKEMASRHVVDTKTKQETMK